MSNAYVSNEKHLAINVFCKIAQENYFCPGLKQFIEIVLTFVPIMLRCWFLFMGYELSCIRLSTFEKETSKNISESNSRWV